MSTQFGFRFSRLVSIVCLCLFAIRPAIAVDPVVRDRPPNIVWIISEDNSKHYLRHFDPNGAPAAAIEAMAAEGITFDRAFSNAPVCSVARTTLITGCYATRLGTQWHRKIQQPSMPSGLQAFPAYLREAGYYTTNRSKKDYNIKVSGAWDESSGRAHWRNRPDEQTPFFHCVSYNDSHEHKLHFPAGDIGQPTTDDPAQVHLPPYLPDTPLARYTTAFYLDRMRVIDGLVSDEIEALRDGGQLENTFVFYFGDHGGVLPRSKGTIYETGLHVPLVVRIPKAYRDTKLVDRSLSIGNHISGFVSFVDFGPTVLHLAGLPLPPGVDGLPFLGPDISQDELEKRNTAFAHTDRFDETYDMNRAVRKGRFKYVRTYNAHHPPLIRNDYRLKTALRVQWERAYREGNLNDVQSAFFEPGSTERLFDLDSDPYETHNLIEQSHLQAVRDDLRELLDSWMTDCRDLGFLTESRFVADAVTDPIAYGLRTEATIEKAKARADLVLEPLEDTVAALDALRQSWDDELNDYWIVNSIVARLKNSDRLPDRQIAKLRSLARELIDGGHIPTAARAAELLVRLGDDIGLDPFASMLQRCAQPADALAVYNALMVLRDEGLIEVPRGDRRLLPPDAFEGQRPIPAAVRSFALP